MSISALPNEILSQIFAFIDSYSTLARCCQVSRRFRDVGSIIKGKEHFWKHCCLNEIPVHALLDLSGKVSVDKICESYSSNKPKYQSSSSRWEELYLMYRRACIIREDRCSELSSMIETNRPVSCLKINGDYLAVGSYYGTVSLWDHLTGHLVIDCYANSGGVTDLQLIDDEGIDLLTPSAKEGLRTRLIVTGGVDRCVVVHVLNMTSYDCDVYWKYECAGRIQNIRVFGHTLVVSAMDSSLVGVRVMDIVRRTVVYQLYGQQSPPTSLAFWEDRVVCGCIKGELISWKIDKTKAIDDEESVVVESDQIVTFNHSFRHMDAVVRDNVVICLTGERDIYVGLDGEFTRHSMSDTLKAHPRSLRMRGGILAIGTSAGTCALYYAPSLNEINAKLSSPPLKVVHTGSDSVRDLDIWDDGDGPMVAIATDGPTVEVVRWYNNLGEK